MRRLIASWPVTAFVVLTFSFSYTVGIATLFASGSFSAQPRLPDLVVRYLGRSGVVFGPSFAAIVVTLCVAGWAGVASLLRTIPFSLRRTPWLVLVPPVYLAIAALAAVLIGTPVATIGSVLAGGWAMWLTHLLLQTLVVGIGEELGWRGWLLPELLRRHSRLRATGVVALIWCLWHVPILLSGATQALSIILSTFAFSILFTALWYRVDGAVGPIALAHGSFNTAIMTFEALGPERAELVWMGSAIMFAVVAMALVVGRWRWWQGGEARDTFNGG